MPTVSVSAASLNQTPLDWVGNRERIVRAIAQARANHSTFLCLPELCITGYGCEDMFYAPHVHARALQVLTSILPETSGIFVNVGLPFKVSDVVYNAAAVIADGKLVGFTAKKNLCGDGVHYEPRWFAPWPVGVQVQVEFAGTSIPFGDVWFDVDGVGVGYEICEDAWVPQRHVHNLAPRGITLVGNPSASHFAFHKRAVVEDLCLTGSKICGGGYVFANLLGCESGRTIYGGDRLIVSKGDIVAAGERFTFRDVEVTTASIDIPAAVQKAEIPAIPVAFSFASAGELTTATSVEDSFVNRASVTLLGQSIRVTKLEEFTRVVALGLFDYMRKSRSKGFVVSLSGGADSSAAACLVACMYAFAVRDSTSEGVVKKLAYWTEFSELEGPDIMKRLLTCVYQSTENSSSVTSNAAAKVAHAVGANFYSFDVAPLVGEYTKLVSAAARHTFSWETDDLVLQNIQARTRSPSVWMLANYLGALLLTTSNRSEAAVGYATMDGDTSGGLALLGGIDKAFLRRWLLWMEQAGPKAFKAFPDLSYVNAQAPTAELKPLSAKQTDERDLMPYEVLDQIERCAVRDKGSPVEVWQHVCGTFKAVHSASELAGWVERFFRLWSVSQWKRERYAPSFHLDDESLDPKTWCRFPILSGGFESELAELRLRVAQK